MNSFTYHMPTKLFVGDLCGYIDEFKGFGKNAFIVTGKSSAKNGALKDLTFILDKLDIKYTVFDETEENPSVANIETAASKAKATCADFVIGLGGGSPLDASKAVAFLAANPSLEVIDLFTPKNISALPLLAIPTTAGTGSDTTPYSVLTCHDKGTKQVISNFLFPAKAFLCAGYMEDMPDSVTLSTAIDAFCHIIEGYLATKSTYMSDLIAEGALRGFAECLPAIVGRNFPRDIREKLIVLSAMGGVVIAQTKTSLPHQMSYALTYHKNIPHGFATAVFLHGFLNIHKNKEKVSKVLKCLDVSDLASFKELIDKIILPDLKSQGYAFTKEDVAAYAGALAAAPERLANYPYPISLDEITQIYDSGISNITL